MKLITVSGPPSSGKTSIILQLAVLLKQHGQHIGIVKFDCLASQDVARYQGKGFQAALGLAGGICPDHYFICNIEACVQWARRQSFDVLISESAGLCNRCAPHIRDIPAVCVIDNLAGIDTPAKLGPMLRFADVIVITKGDMVSQAEREVFAFHVQRENPLAAVWNMNGISGQGIFRLTQFVQNAPETDTLVDYFLRFPMPAAHCSYCVGQTRIGDTYQVGLTRKISFDDD